ncbi:YdcF family protein [Streptomyces sp. NBC_01294]|uniref:YdcF family protein n=1 Tax=Streptomyces sp. NBC_01294 TaxID=2903815 RepID=UPI002DD7C337|nr:YdcF family protein [Streptomyces sp. NBC_01294]WRZ58715.1 YdcF family protein [Streptomyces sp. NBC_01294]
MDLFTAALDHLPKTAPGRSDRALSVQIVAEGPDGGRTCSGLVLGTSDAVGRWHGDVPAADVRLEVPYDALRDAASGTTLGTGLVMSGRVRMEGDWPALAAFRGAARGAGLRAYLDRLAAAAAPPGPDGGPAAGGGRAANGAVPAGAGPAGAGGLVAVLAAPNDEHGELSVMARDRSRTALDLVRSTPGARLVLTGGFGAQFNTTDVPHWRHCARWLRSQGMGPGEFADCLETRHSSDDVLFLRELARRPGTGRVTVVTSDYHADRIRYLLDLVLPAAAVRAVVHPSLPPAQQAQLRGHDEVALAKSVAAALLFGPDRLLAPLRVTVEDGAERYAPAGA